MVVDDITEGLIWNGKFMLVSVLSGSVTVSKLVFYAQSTGTVIPLSGQKCDCETDSVTDFAVLICDF